MRDCVYCVGYSHEAKHEKRKLCEDLKKIAKGCEDENYVMLKRKMKKNFK